MDQLQVKAYAKINLALDVLSKRHDGYHNIRTIMQCLALHDTLEIEKARERERSVSVACESSNVPVNETNLAYKAAIRMIDTFGLQHGVNIHIHKVIPVSAGLAGGSSNAAATLRGINELFGLGLSLYALADIGKSIGADVPYCVFGGTVLAEGIGEKLTPLPDHPPISVVLAKPSVEVSTSQVFREFAQADIAGEPDFNTIINGIRLDNINEISRGISSGVANVLECVTAATHPIIHDIKSELMQSGALCAQMSGSGPTVFAYFTNKAHAVAAAQALRYKLPQITEIYVTCISHVPAWLRAIPKWNVPK